MRKKFFTILWTVLLAGILTVVAAFWAIATGRIGYMPDLSQLQNPVNKFASQVFSADGRLLGTCRGSRLYGLRPG